MSEPQKGFKTSEFWLTLAAQALGAVAASGALPGGPVAQVAGLATTVLASLGYTASRAAVKRKSLVEAFGAKDVKR
jgi:hypothetical protein